MNFSNNRLFNVAYLSCLAWFLSLFCIHHKWSSVSAHASPASIGNQSSHIFDNTSFWRHFRRQVHLKSWRCDFPKQILWDNLEKDSSLYRNAAVFRERRRKVAEWLGNEAAWISLVLGACRELADNLEGPSCKRLSEAHLLEAFSDFVFHIDYFYKVASEMRGKGYPVTAFSQNSSNIHDIDKLDPVMLVGYSERFEDNVSTSVWEACVDRHVHVNPHHQNHCLWHSCCRDLAPYSTCEDTRQDVIREMVCDKVSRRVQKNLDGRMVPEMWDVDMEFFKGLPDLWLKKVVELMHILKSGP